MSEKRRDENAPWSAEIRQNPTGLPGVVNKRLEKNGVVTYAEVEDGANAGHRTVKRIFERLVNLGKAEFTEQGITVKK